MSSGRAVRDPDRDLDLDLDLDTMTVQVEHGAYQGELVPVKTRASANAGMKRATGSRSSNAPSS